MLLATATPVQLHPIEAWDLLSILSNGNEGVLGGKTGTSRWYSAYRTIQIATGEQTVPADDEVEGWEFVRDPLPAATEDPAIEKIRRQLRAPDKKWQFTPETIDKLPVAVRRVQLKNKLLPDYGERFNPLLRCIVRRTRSYLEQEINPATGSYYLPKVEVKLFGEDENDAINLGGYLKEAYEEAETFSELLQKRMRGPGFFKTLLLRRLGSSMEAGRNTVGKLLGVSPVSVEDEDEDDADEDLFGKEGQERGYSEFRNFSTDEITSLERCLNLLKQGGNRDPKLEAVLGYLLGTNPNAAERWVDRGCILFSQYYDTVRWMGDELAKHPDIPSDLTIGLYAGSNRSGFWLGGRFQRCDRTLLKNRVRKGEIKMLLGTDAASEGLNLQRLGTLINIDLPWNPTRLEQRKGRIQRIGQPRNQLWIANLRYRDSVEDKVHRVLAERLQAIHELFGQIPDTLEDVWVKIALNDEAEIAELIDQTTATRNPFDKKYSKVEDAAWETCALVLNPITVRELMEMAWG
jgi:hypothetical protein